MKAQFDSFVIFAEMRTGSNYLETNLNQIDGVESFGEAFNPHFIGFPNRSALLEVTQATRDADPDRLLEKIKAVEGIGGFRYFHDHDPRVLPTILNDRGCAKIILTRNPVESFVSWKIAQHTGQWKLTNIARRRDAKVRFNAGEFAQYLKRLQEFQSHLRQSLQCSGQTAFYIDYNDLQSVDVLNGLVRFLGVSGQLTKLDKSLKVQNPSALAEKVENVADLERFISTATALDVHSPSIRESHRFAVAKSYVTASKAPLMFLPISGGPDASIRRWLADLDGVSVSDLPSGFTQKELRKWKRTRPGHRSFTVIRHPVARAHHVYCSYILRDNSQYSSIRQALSRFSGGAVPVDEPNEDYTIEAYRQGIIAFLKFVQANLTGQTVIRTDALWASQAQIISGFSQFAAPDNILREDELVDDLSALAMKTGCAAKPPEPEPSNSPFSLNDVYDDALEDATRRAYQRDYMAFGFGTWK